MKIYQTPALIKLIFPGVIWDLKGNGQSIYLTFDDGPIPGASEYILDLLDEYDAKATFFCVGENVVKNPKLFIPKSVPLKAILSKFPKTCEKVKKNSLTQITS